MEEFFVFIPLVYSGKEVKEQFLIASCGLTSCFADRN